MLMYSLLDVLKGSVVIINMSSEHRDDVTSGSLFDDVNVQGNDNIFPVC